MRSFKTLPNNARACIALEPLWAFFGPIVAYYAPLYQQALGLGEVQMGTLNSANIAAGFICFMLAAPITNRLGRRKTSLIFDLFAWSMAMTVWALAKNFIWFLAASLLNGIVRIVVVSWNLLITEDARAEQRPVIHGWIYLIGSISGFSTFIGGLIIERNGIIPSMRLLYLSGAIAMTTMFVVRFLLTRETAPGLLLIEKTRGKSFFASVVAQIVDAKTALRDRHFLRLLGLFIISNAVLYIDFYRVLFLQGPKSLSTMTIAILPACGAVLSLVLFFLVLPRLGAYNNERIMSYSFLACAFFQSLMILMPPNAIVLSILAVSGVQTGYFVVQTFRDTVFMNTTSEDRRSELFGLVQALMLLASIPVGWLAGLLYTVSPELPFAAAALLYLAGFFLSRRAAIVRSA